LRNIDEIRPYEGNPRQNDQAVEAVAEMRRDAAAGQSAAEIARRFGVAKLTAYSAIVGMTWNSVTQPAPLGRLRRKAS
jgi:hypothetical protein